uniref:Uncharacterized protein LOC116309115 n=1 Tax=Actinia tenebrosa TaxID=6105 RepID=A0A6P8JH65_ACTTE
MSMKVVLISCLLVLIATDRGLSCFPSRGGGGGGGGRTTNKAQITVPSCCPESQSPSGGPSQNKGAAVCYFYRSSLQVKCIKDNSVHTCDVARAPDRYESDPKGPTPYGEYLIGKHRYDTNYPGLDWFNLYPKKEDNTGYYGYFSANNQGRSQMGLHPGRVSWGCVTVSTPHCSGGDIINCYNSDSCWTSIKNIVNSGHMNYKGYSYSGILYVV